MCPNAKQNVKILSANFKQVSLLPQIICFIVKLTVEKYFGFVHELETTVQRMK